MRLGLVLGVGLLCLACVGVVAANEPPLAGAGLDQESRVNATVYLDAGGSIDPDGSIERYEWTIEAPDGNTTTPDCRTCTQTWFVPRQTGRYNVTVEVADGNGASRADTLYVDVGGVASARQPPSTPAASGGGGTAPSLGGSSGGGGGSGLSGSRWSAVVDEGDELVLSNPRGADFVFDTPTGEVTIDSSELQKARQNDGEVTYDEVSGHFLAEDAPRPVLEEATTAATEEGNACQSTSGSCTTRLRETDSLSGTASGQDGFRSDTRGMSPTNPADAVEIGVHGQDSADSGGTANPISGFFDGVSDALGRTEQNYGTEGGDHGYGNSPTEVGKDIVNSVFSGGTSEDDDDDESGWETGVDDESGRGSEVDDHDPGVDEPAGSDVPIEL